MASPELSWAIERIAADRAKAGVVADRYDVHAARAANPPTDLPAPEGVEERLTRIEGVPCVWVVPRGADPARRIVYLHGGGLCAGGYHSHRTLATWLAALAGSALLFVQYRLAPEHRVPAQLEDAWTAFRHAAGHGPDGRAAAARRLVVAGDSAGGALALAMAIRARDQGGPRPDGVVSLCGMLDFDERTSAFIRMTQRTRDMVRGLATWMDDLKDPLVSPILADPAGLPPLLLQTGSDDYCRDDSVRMADRVRAAGGPVVLEVWPEMIHVWQRFAPKLPEAMDALRRVAAFVDELPQRSA